MRGVALGGFMGSGKSTVAAELAHRLGVVWVDTDAVLAARHGPVAEQVRLGEAAFRDRERALLVELCDGVPRVLSTGGGAWDVARAVLRGHYHRVVLTAPLPTLRRRVGDGEGRPLWERAEALLEARRAGYADADLVVDTEHKSPAQVAEEIVAWLS